MQNLRGVWAARGVWPPTGVGAASRPSERISREWMQVHGHACTCMNIALSLEQCTCMELFEASSIIRFSRRVRLSRSFLFSVMLRFIVSLRIIGTSQSEGSYARRTNHTVCAPCPTDILHRLTFWVWLSSSVAPGMAPPLLCFLFRRDFFFLKSTILEPCSRAIPK